MDLQTQLGSLISEVETHHQRRLTPEEIRQTYQTVVGYGLRIRKADQIKELGKTLDAETEVRVFRIRLDNSYYVLSCYWRSIYSLFRPDCRFCKKSKDSCGECKYRPSISKISKHYGVSESDMWLTKDYLTANDFAEIRMKARRDDYFRDPSEKRLQKVMKDVRNFCWYVARKKIGFLARFDPMLGLDDLFKELQTVALQNARRYDSLRNYAHYKNSVNKAIWDYALNMVEYYQTDKRSRMRISGTTNARFQKVWKPETSRYEKAVVSRQKVQWLGKKYGYDSVEISTDCEETQNLASHGDAYDRLFLQDFLTKLGKRVPSNFQQYLEVMQGGRHAEFEAWLQQQEYRGHRINELEQVAFYARRFFGISSEDLAKTHRIVARMGFRNLDEVVAS